MALSKLTADVAVIQKLSVYPNEEDGLTAEELQARFDAGPEAIKDFINDTMIPELESRFTNERSETDSALETQKTQTEARLGTVEGAIQTIAGEIIPSMRDRENHLEERIGILENASTVYDEQFEKVDARFSIAETNIIALSMGLNTLDKAAVKSVNGHTPDENGEVEIIDDTAVGADAWSSRNIVDKLCPALSERGSTVTCTPVEGYPLEVVSHIAPVQEIGSDGISPSSVCPITGWDSVTLWHGGKNLFDISRVQSNGGIVINNGDGSLSVNARAKPASGAVTLRDYAPGLQPGKTYTLSADYSHTGNYIYLKGIDQSWSFGKARVITAACLDSKVFWYNSSDATGTDTTENIIRNIQIEEGTAATEFEAYRGASFTVALGQTVGKGIYNWNTGVLTITHALIRLTSDMNWVMTGSSNPNGIRSFYVNDPIENGQASSASQPVISSHYPHVYNWSVNSTTYEYAIKILNFMIYLSDVRFTDLDSFKTFLDEENVQLLYLLAEPVTVQLDSTEILALSGANVLCSDTGDTEVTGRADPIAFSANLIKRIAALEAAAVNNT